MGLTWLALTAASPAPSTASSTGEQVATLLEGGKPIEAFALAQQKAGEGDPEGDFALGWFYDNGDHITADKPKAAGHYRKCADAGLAQCQWRLGVMLDTGEGVTADPKAAFALLSKAATQGSPQANVSLAVMHASGHGTPVDFAKAMQYYKAGAAKGEPHGFYGVGLLYLDGQGVPVDREAAAAWFSVGTALGDEPSKAAADQLLAGAETAVLDRVSKMANAIYAEYTAPPPAAGAAKKP